MRAYVQIIIEQKSHEHWMAWFAEIPQCPAGGRWAADALARLLLLFGHEQFEIADTSSVAGAARPGHVEVVIPLRRRLRMPKPSVN